MFVVVAVTFPSGSPAVVASHDTYGESADLLRQIQDGVQPAVSKWGAYIASVETGVTASVYAHNAHIGVNFDLITEPIRVATIEGQTMLDGTDVPKVLPECENCSDDIADPSDMVTLNGHYTYCTECVRACSDCGTVTLTDEMTKGPDNEYRCESCHNEAFTTCEVCESDTDRDDMTSVNVVRNGTWRTATEQWCETCVRQNAWKCDGCNEQHSDTDQFANHLSCCSIDLCDSCSENSSYCESCDEYRCDGCGPCDCHNSEYVHDCSYRPTPVFHRAPGEVSNRQGANPPNYYFGVELELTGDYEMANAVIGGLQDGEETDWYAKEDGSVQGVEFVSHPRTLASWQAFDMAKFMRTVIRAGAEGGRDGLHVHISRTAFKSANHFRRFHDLVTRGDDNKAFTEHMAGRTENNWAKFARHPRTAVSKAHRNECRYRAPEGTTDGYGYRVTNGYFERYEVLNVTNRSTVEFRLGCSTTDATEFLAVVEYLAACVEYTRGVTLTTEVWGALTCNALWDYLADNMATYPHAVQHAMAYASRLLDA